MRGILYAIQTDEAIHKNRSQTTNRLEEFLCHFCGLLCDFGAGLAYSIEPPGSVGILLFSE